MAAYVLDTHVWLWLLGSPQKLSPKVRKLITTVLSSSSGDQLMLSAITLVEVATHVKKGRLTADSPLGSWLQQSIEAYDIMVVPVSAEVAVETANLEMNHFDPADRIIAATALVQNATLVTADRVLRKCQQLRTMW